MALPEASAWAILIGVVLVAAVVGFRPLLARLAARNIGRRKSRVLIVVAGLLVGTAIISSSLVVGDTLSYIFLEDVYARLDAIDELVSNSFNGQLFSFAETNFTEIGGDLAVNATPIDGIAPALLKVMPVRNVVGNKGNQQITVMGLNASHEGGFGPLTLLDGRSVDTDQVPPAGLYANERAAADLNATAGQDLTLFYGTTNQTIVHATVAGIVRDAGKAAYESRAILFMDLRRAQAAFNESGAINLIRVSNRGGIADSVAYSDRVTQDLRLSIATRHLLLRVEAVKADDTAQAVQIGRDATDLFLVMGAFGILAGVLLIVNIFVMLAEERKPELGVARAVGFLRSDLLTTFALEGTFYAVVAARPRRRNPGRPRRNRPDRVGLRGRHGNGENPGAAGPEPRTRNRGGVPRMGASRDDRRRGLQSRVDLAPVHVAESGDGQCVNCVCHGRRHPRRLRHPDRRVQRERGPAGRPPEGEPRRGPPGAEDRDLVSDGQTLPHGDDRRNVRADPLHGHVDLDAPGPPGREPQFVRAAAVRRLRRDRLHDVVRRDPEFPAAPRGKLQRLIVPQRVQRDLDRERDASESPGRRRQSDLRLHALGRGQLPDPVEPVLIHEFPAVVCERIERPKTSPDEPHGCLALPPVQSHPGHRGPHGRGPEPVRAGREPLARGAGRPHPRVRCRGSHGEPDDCRRPRTGPAVHLRGVRRPERRPGCVPHGRALHGVLLPDGVRRRRRRVSGGPRAHVLRVRPADDRHPRADRAGVRRVAGGPDAHAGVPGNRTPRRDRGPRGDHAPCGRRATDANRGAAGNRLHAGNGPGDVPRRDRLDRGPGNRDRGRPRDRPGLQDLHRLLRGHRRIQRAVA